ncbi:Lsr2 family protein [Rathayibacter sp. VKM Ac-2835]|uniref:histone-like nucleoid-structuring protein Lsr2 n=1 Tax=Rathayibacter sp. VKM Ac-2835 TaxID=2739043 RepID=UPI001C275627|nr:Lsr2 family protein [Rathayibacter sp. VKM Ac-2835]
MSTLWRFSSSQGLTIGVAAAASAPARRRSDAPRPRHDDRYCGGGICVSGAGRGRVIDRVASRVDLVDDLTGALIPPGRGRTVDFSVDDDAYEIDLTAANIGYLHLALARFVDAARPLSPARVAPRVTAVAASAGRKSPEMLAAIRHWARRHGYEVPRSGRVPADVQAAYDAAH